MSNESVRHEASPLDWESLTADQRDAAAEAVSLIGTLATATSAELRRNQVILIDGPRGTGKTTVLMSVAKMFKDGLAARPRRVLGTGEKNWKGPDWNGPEDAVVIPLDPLDLHPLGEDTDLTIAVAGRLRRIDETIDKAVKRGPQEPQRPECEDRTPSRKLADAWNRLTEAIASASAGSRERMARVGPDVVSVELRQGVPDLERDFSRFVGAVKEHVEHRYPCQHILFVLPIDDADLVPRRTMEVMQLLRAFYHPSIVFLLTGDSQLFVRSLRASVLEQLWGRLHVLPTDAKQRDSVDPADYASELARDVYDRVIPLPHRCRVRAVDPPHLLDPGRDTTDVRVGSPKWWLEKLKRLTIQREWAGQSGTTGLSVADALRLTPIRVLSPVQQSPSTAAFVRAIQTLCDDPKQLRLSRALPGRKRALRDLEIEIEKGFLRHGPDSAAWHFLSRLWDVAIDRSDVSVDQERGLRRMITVDERDDGSALRIESSQGHQRIELRTVSEHLFRTWAKSPLSVRSVVRFDAVLKGARADHRLPRTVGACLALVLDCEDEDRRSTVIGELPLPDAVTSALVFAEDVASATSIPWPTPTLSPLQAERASRLLRHLLYDRVDAGEKRVVQGAITLLEGADGLSADTVFAAWLEVTAQVLVKPHEIDLGSLIESIPIDSLESKLSPELRLEIVRNCLQAIDVRLRNAPADRLNFGRRWLASLGVFALPQFGLRPEMSRVILSFVNDAFKDEPELRLDASRDWYLRAVPVRDKKELPRELDALLTKALAEKTPGRTPAPDAGAFFGVANRWPSALFTRGDPGRADRYVSNVASRRESLRELASPFWQDLPVPESREALVRALRDHLESLVAPTIVRARLVESSPDTLSVQYDPEVPDLPDDARLARLVLFDLEQDAATGSADPAWADFPLSTGADARWPCPPFPAGYDLERFAQAWNAASRSARPTSTLTPTSLLPGGDLGNPADVLFARYLSFWHMVCLRDSKETDAAAALLDLLKVRIGEERYEEGSSRRWSAFKQFREELGVMSDARFGLSPKSRGHVKKLWEEHADKRGLSLSTILRRVRARQYAKG